MSMYAQKLENHFFWYRLDATLRSPKFHEVHVPDRTKPQLARTNPKILTQTGQNLGLKHLVACHERGIDVKTNKTMRSASLCIVSGHRIHKMVNCFRDAYWFSVDTARWLISSGFGSIVIQNISTSVCACGNKSTV